MALEQNLCCISKVAAADLSAAQYKFVEQNASKQITVCNAAGEKVLGVLQNNPKSGETGSVAIDGTTKVVAGAAIAVDADVATDASGQAITAATGNKIVGRAMSAAGAAGEIVSVLLRSGPAAAA